MTTVLRKHTKQYHHKSRFARYLQYLRDVGPSHIVTNCTLDFANWTLGFAWVFGETRHWLGGSWFLTRYLKYLGHVVVHRSLAALLLSGGVGVGGGMMTYRQLLEHHAPLQRQTLLR